MQHPKEARHAKNSARLLPLSLAHCEVIEGESEADFALLRDTCLTQPAQHALFYPCAASQTFESHYSGQTELPNTLLFIDATWRKAYKMYQLNPWLSQLPAWHFSQPPAGQYHIRKTSVTHGLSTLEAVAYVLATGYQVNSQPLLDLFAAMQQGHRHPLR